MICSVAIFIGAVVSAAGSNQQSFALVVAGRVIMGFGSTVIETCTSKVGSAKDIHDSSLGRADDTDSQTSRSWPIGSNTAVLAWSTV